MIDARKYDITTTSGARIVSAFIAAVVFGIVFAAPASGQNAIEPVSEWANSHSAKYDAATASAAAQAVKSKQAGPVLLYVFSTATNASLTDMSAGTTQLVPADADDQATVPTGIGFDFIFQAVRYTQFSVNSNGVLRLGGASVQGGGPYKPLGQASLALITAYAADLRTHDVRLLMPI